MSKIMDAEDILADAQNCVECIFMAASGLGGGLSHDATDPLQTVADIASNKITEAIALLDEYRIDIGAGPEPATDAKPELPAARPKRRIK
jgi:hypothetical protein